MWLYEWGIDNFHLSFLMNDLSLGLYKE